MKAIIQRIGTGIGAAAAVALMLGLSGAGGRPRAANPPAAPGPVPSRGPSIPERVRVEQTFGGLPLYLVENRGQVDEAVRYYVQGSEETLYFDNGGITFSLGGKDRRWNVRLDFVGAGPDVVVRGEDPAQAVFSYFKGKPEEWKTGLPAYRKVVYEGLWPGIDLVYSGSVNQLKYEFVVRPGADPGRIRLAYRGTSGVAVKESGELAVTTPRGGFEDAAPRAYQEVEGRRVEVPMAYRLDAEPAGGAYLYGFEVGRYDPSRTLVLDPAVMIYCGFIGGATEDSAYGIAVDPWGNAYVVGSTDSSQASFPVVVGPDLTQNGNMDVFVAKLNPEGTDLEYCGYIGGTEGDYGAGIAVDGEGSAYVVGQVNSSQASFPVRGGPDLTFNGVSDVFVAKVDPQGTDLEYCGYIGGSLADWGSDVAVDDLGSAFVTGTTESADFPVRIGPDLTHNGNWDAFVAKVNPDGSDLEYCGFVGGTDVESGEGIALDPGGRACIAGFTRSTQASFPVGVGPDLTFNGGEDAFVARINATGAGLEYCGYIGGTSTEYGYDVAVDDLGNAFVTGHTLSTQASFPVGVGPDLTQNGGWDAFVAKVNLDGSDLDFCGYVGGAQDDFGLAVAVDRDGNAHLAGTTLSSEATFPVGEGPDLTFNGVMDAFVAKVDPSGTGLEYCGYIGGTARDEGYAIAIGPEGSAFLAGSTESWEDSFPVLTGPDTTFNGGFTDGWVSKYAEVITACQGIDDENVLFVNGDNGTGGYHRVSIRAGRPLFFAIQRPSGGGAGQFVVHMNSGVPDPSTVTTLPAGLGVFCFPVMMPPGGSATPVAVWNNIGGANRVGESSYFGTPIPDPEPAPVFFFTAPGGDDDNLPAGSRWTLQGIIRNPAAGNPLLASVTNGIVIEVH